MTAFCLLPTAFLNFHDGDPLTFALLLKDDATAEHLPRFFEFEAREIIKRAGIPVTDYGFTTDPAEAAEIARRIGGPTVIKSQVLSGGRMKAGGVKFADTPEQATTGRSPAAGARR